MKNKWWIPVALFVILIIAHVVRGFVATRITVEMLQTDKIEESASCSGVLIKNESVHSVSISGVAEILVKSGDRVSNGQLLATFYSNTEEEIEEGVIEKLADINKRIAAINAGNSDDANFISDAAKIESKIADNVDEIIAEMAERKAENISEYKYIISTYADQKAVAKGEKDGLNNELARLQAEKSVLEEKLGKIQRAVQANMPGIFVEEQDGFEQTLLTNSIETLTPNTIKDVINQDKNGKMVMSDEGTYVYKIVDNYLYYIAVNLGEEMTENLSVGDSVKLRFGDFAAGEFPAVVRYISDADKDGVKTVVSECNMFVDGLLENRVVNVDFVKKSVSGYKVSIDYLHTVDNSVGLFVKRGAVMKFIPVDIIYSTDEEAIVSALSSEKPLKSYDEVVTSAPEFADGKVIVSQ